MPEVKFDSLENLYLRLLPALRIKKQDMLREKMILVNEKNLWHYFCKYVWQKKSSLCLSEMVDDILNMDNATIYIQIRKEEQPREY